MTTGVIGDEYVSQWPIDAGFIVQDPAIVAYPGYQPSVSDYVVLGTASYSDGSVASSILASDYIGSDVIGSMAVGYGSTLSSLNSTTIRVSDKGWRTQPSDAIPNTDFEGRLELPQIDWSIPMSPSQTARVVATSAVIRLANDDGVYDDLPASYGVDGQSVTISLLPSRGSSTTDALPVFKGVGTAWVVERGALDLTVSDIGWQLSQTPFLRLYGGTGGADGYTDPYTLLSNQAGKGIPKCYGICENISPVLIDPINGVYQIHDGSIRSIDGAYWMGYPATSGNSYGSYAALASATTAAGTYDWSISTSGSYIKPGSPTASGQFTCDVHGALDARGEYYDDHASVFYNALSTFISQSNFDLLSIGQFTVGTPGSMGIYVDTQTTLSDVADTIMVSCLGVWGDFGNGLISVFPLTQASSVQSGTQIDYRHITGEIQPISLPSEVSPCIWRVRCGYAKNWTVMSGAQVAQPSGSLTVDRRNYLQSPYLVTSQSAPTRLMRNPKAIDYPTHNLEVMNIDAGQIGSNTTLPILNTLFANKSDADGIASNLLNIWKPGLCAYSVPVGSVWTTLKRYQNIFLVYPRYGFSSGKWVKVVGAQITGTNALLTVVG